jgi:hypothetical protein
MPARGRCAERSVKDHWRSIESARILRQGLWTGLQIEVVRIRGGRAIPPARRMDRGSQR